MAHENPEKMLDMLKSVEGDAFLLDFWNAVARQAKIFQPKTMSLQKD